MRRTPKNAHWKSKMVWIIKWFHFCLFAATHKRSNAFVRLTLCRAYTVKCTIGCVFVLMSRFTLFQTVSRRTNILFKTIQLKIFKTVLETSILVRCHFSTDIFGSLECCSIFISISYSSDTYARLLFAQFMSFILQLEMKSNLQVKMVFRAHRQPRQLSEGI